MVGSVLDLLRVMNPLIRVFVRVSAKITVTVES